MLRIFLLVYLAPCIGRPITFLPLVVKDLKTGIALGCKLQEFLILRCSTECPMKNQLEIVMVETFYIPVVSNMYFLSSQLMYLCPYHRKICCTNIWSVLHNYAHFLLPLIEDSQFLYGPSCACPHLSPALQQYGLAPIECPWPRNALRLPCPSMPQYKASVTVPDSDGPERYEPPCAFVTTPLCRGPL